MAYTTPKYGLQVPSPTTKMNELGLELQQMGISIEEVLDSFDYNGADPSLVLSQVAALQNHVSNIMDRIEDSEPWTDMNLNSGLSGIAQYKRERDTITVRITFDNSVTAGSAMQVLTMPQGTHPVMRHPLICSTSNMYEGSSYVDTDGVIRWRQGPNQAVPYMYGIWDRV